MIKNKKLFFVFIICCLFLIFLYNYGFLYNYNLKFTDSFYGSDLVNREIVIVKLDDKSISQLGNWPINRSYYANFIEKANNSKVIGLDIGFYEKSNNFNADKKLREVVLKNKDKVVLPVEFLGFEIRNNDVYSTSDILKPFFSCNNLSCGYVNIIIDSDGIARAVNLNIKGNYTSFTQVIYDKVYNKSYEYNESRFLINFLKEDDGFVEYSFADVLKDDFDNSVFEDKIVLLGTTSKSLHDFVKTPVSKSYLMPGVEFHGNVLNTMIYDNYIKKPSLWINSFIIVFFVFVTFVIFRFLKPFKTGLFLIFLSFLYLFLSLLIFEVYNFILNVFFVFFSIFFSYLIVLGFYYTDEIKKKKYIKNAFGKYVSPVLVDEISKSPQVLKLGGSSRYITILFSDIANFTSISEKLSSKQLTKLLNDYLTDMSYIVTNNKGFVDKYIGDAVMAFWGAPLYDDNQVFNACKTAVEMIEKVKEKKKEYFKEYGVDFDIRIGIDYGKVTVGNMGSINRFDYTVIGDSVNLASRLEAINKEYGTFICVSENVYKKVKSKFKFRELDFIRAKGKKEVTKIFELNNSLDDDIIKSFNDALILYRKGNFERAFEKFKVLSKQDKVSKMFLKRVKELKNNSFDKWDGIYTQTKK